MSGRSSALAAWAPILLAASTTVAQERPREEDLFGGAPDGGSREAERTGPSIPRPNNAPDAGTPARAGEAQLSPAPAARENPLGAQTTQDERGLASAIGKDLFTTGPGRDNPLQIGGQIFLPTLLQATGNCSHLQTPIPPP